jgi:hypothetical protein
MGVNTPFYIVGEAYSTTQGWIEGSLESVDELFTAIKPIKTIGGKGASVKVDVQALKKKFPGKEWVLLRDGDIVHVVDVTQWKFIHPGGNVYEKYLYGDISGAFRNVPYHVEAGTSKLKSTVRDAIHKYTLTTLTP